MAKLNVDSLISSIKGFVDGGGNAQAQAGGAVAPADSRVLAGRPQAPNAPATIIPPARLLPQIPANGNAVAPAPGGGAAPTDRPLIASQVQPAGMVPQGSNPGLQQSPDRGLQDAGGNLNIQPAINPAVLSKLKLGPVQYHPAVGLHVKVQ